MNYIGQVNQAFGNLGQQTLSQATGMTIPGFIGADNRRDDEFERIPGLRLTQVRQGREGNWVSVWAVDNSVAGFVETSESGKRDGITKRIKQAWGDAVKALEDKYDCFEYLIKDSNISKNPVTLSVGAKNDEGGNTSVSPITILKDMYSSRITYVGGNSIEAGGRDANNRGEITLGNSFFSDMLAKGLIRFDKATLPSNFTPEQARTLVILHGLKHVMGVYHAGNDAQGNEIKDGNHDGAFNDNILAKCL